MKFDRCRSCRDEVVWWALCVNVAQTIYKGTLGALTGSAALAADAMHSGADVLATLVTIFSVKLSSRSADEKHPYGYGNIQYVSSSVVGLILILGAFYLIYGSVAKIVSGDITAPSVVAILGAGISVITNELMYRYQSCVGSANNSPAIIANAWDNRSDAISSVGVLVGIGFAVMGFPIADSLTAIGVGLLVAKIGVGLNVEAVKGLMDSSVEIDVLKSVYDIAKTTPKVEGVCFLRGRSVGEEVHLEVCVYVDGSLKVFESDIITAALRKRILSEIDHVRDAFVSVVPGKPRKKSRRAGRPSPLAAAAE